jgi:asparagine synthase (glutamine-hydrolysing)
MLQHVERVVDLLDPSLNHLFNMDVDEARRRVLSNDPASVRAIEGSFAIVARDGITVRLARSMDRPMRYFLAKRQEGPALFVADRIDALQRALAAEGLDDQFHPSYTRMVPAHHLVEIGWWDVRTRTRPTHASSRPSARRCRAISTRSAAAMSVRWRRSPPNG